ncbi:unnamed protein product [Owenia fusiformis]|uniref:Uncharacterized protein n=1 Tax=Owenia fusiformis TaxID=6347 RepID=A0A8S4PST1_OWEFU|nr:unnamed protein product [Owenia fusiformis]
MSRPLFPSLLPHPSDSAWFNVDKPCDDENELSKLEEEHNTWLQRIRDRGSDITPIGKTSEGTFDDDDDEDEDDEADDDEDSESNDDELDTDMIDAADSPDDAELDTNDPTSDSPSWGL